MTTSEWRSREARLERLREYVREDPDLYHRTVLERDIDALEAELERLECLAEKRVVYEEER
jgi:hypothetical protein